MILENKNEALKIILSDAKELKLNEMKLNGNYFETDSKELLYKHTNEKFKVLELSYWFEYSKTTDYLQLKIDFFTTYENNLGVFVSKPRTKEEDEFYVVSIVIDSRFKHDESITVEEHFAKCIREVSNGIEAMID